MYNELTSSTVWKWHRNPKQQSTNSSVTNDSYLPPYWNGTNPRNTGKDNDVTSSSLVPVEAFWERGFISQGSPRPGSFPANHALSIWEHKHGLSYRLFSFMSAKVWTPSLRTVFVFCKSLCSGILKKFSMWVFATMDCLKGIYNGIGIRFFMMALIKIWTLVMYVLRRNLKKVCLSS